MLNLRKLTQTASTASPHTVSQRARFKPLAGILAVMGGLAASGEVSSQVVQDNFPFQQAIIGAKSPEDNVAKKGLAIRLDHGAAVCFDMDLLRMTAGWTGGFITETGVTFNGAHGPHPKIDGDQQFGTPVVSGWTGQSAEFVDPREVPFGPVPDTLGQWKGLYVHGDDVVLSYRIKDTQVHEQPSSLKEGDRIALARTFKIQPAKGRENSKITEDLHLMVCQVAGAEGNVSAQGVASLETTDHVTKAGLVDAPQGSKLTIQGNRIILKIPEGTASNTFRLVVWNGKQASSDQFSSFLDRPVKMVNFMEAGPEHWPKEVVTKGVVGADSTPDGAYALDRLTPPQDNPWDRRVRPGGFDFFKGGKRAALSTWDGDIWIVSGIDKDLDELRWKRFASGLFETLGLTIVDGTIYVSSRVGLIRFQDFNNDGTADFYETFNDDLMASTGFHEFVFDLRRGPDGWFYFSKAGPVRSGGRGFGGDYGTVTKHAGSVLRVSPDGENLEVYATGFRAPNGIGVSPTGQVTTGDNEGTWVPACPINWVKKGGFYGVEDLAHKKPIPEYDKPICWLSKKNFDNSGGGQAWVTTDQWGPLKGELLHLSYGKSKLFLVMKQNVGEQIQGGVVELPLRFTSSCMRGRFNPADGQLYICGLRGWQTRAANLAGVDRVRYTGKPVKSARDIKVDSAGVHLTFTQPLDPESATDPQNYSAQQWNYRRTSSYGSPEYSVKNPDKRGRDYVDIKSIELSKDQKIVTLKVPDLQPVMQFLIRYSGIKTKDGSEIQQDVLMSIHQIPDA